MKKDKVVLISCSKLKRTYSCEARLLYDASHLFRKSLAYAQTLSSDIYVISAKYGLVSLTETIAPYDESLNDKTSAELAAWGERTAAQITERYDVGQTEFIILAGKNYYAPLQQHLPLIKLPLLGLPMGERLAKLDELLCVDTVDQSPMCHRLHKLFNAMPRFQWDTIGKIDFDSGIYIIFEAGEIYCGMDRIVRVGTHRSDGRLRKRLKNHFCDENKDGSIFRKNIGRAILNKNGNPYLEIWNIDPSKQDSAADIVGYNAVFQKKVEAAVSEYMREHFSFVCFPVATKDERLRLEEGIIASLNLASDFNPSPDWRGKYSPEYEISQSGLWLKQGLDGAPLSEAEYSFIEGYCSGLGNTSPNQSAQVTMPSKHTYEHDERSADVLWQSMIQKLTQSPCEIQTISQSGAKGNWIYVSSDNRSILVDRAKHNIPSSSMAVVRSISKNEFTKLYPLYFQWRQKHITREEAKGGSMNSSYIFALISHFDAATQ